MLGFGRRVEVRRRERERVVRESNVSIIIVGPACLGRGAKFLVNESWHAADGALGLSCLPG